MCIFDKVLIQGGETSIEVAWNAVKNTDQYLLQICPLGGMEKKKKPVEKPEEKSENKAPAKPAEHQSQPTENKEKPVENKEKTTEAEKPAENQEKPAESEKTPEKPKEAEEKSEKPEEKKDESKPAPENNETKSTEKSADAENTQPKESEKAETESKSSKEPEKMDVDKPESESTVKPASESKPEEKAAEPADDGGATPTRDEAEDKMDTTPPKDPSSDEKPKETEQQPSDKPVEKAAEPAKENEPEKPKVSEPKPAEPKPTEPKIEPKVIEKPKPEGPQWFDVAMIPSVSQPRHEIKSYYVESETKTDEVCLFLDQNKFWKKNALSSGITYKVRVCAINSCGRSIFSDNSNYKTTVPGFPRAPTSIKVTKTEEGASLSWSPPVNTEIIEYSVYLAVKQSQATGKTNNFIRVYLGHQPKCIVSHSQLAQVAIVCLKPNLMPFLGGYKH